MTLLDTWQKFHEAVLQLAVRKEPIQDGLLNALLIIQTLRAEDFPEDLQPRFAMFEAKLEAGMSAMKGNPPEGKLFATVKVMTSSSAHEVVTEIAALYEEITRRIIGGTTDLGADLL
jgi:hypothetical protein